MNIFFIVAFTILIITVSVVSLINKRWRKLLSKIAVSLALKKGIAMVPRISGEINGVKVAVRRQSGLLLVFISHRIENIGLLRVNKILAVDGYSNFKVANILTGDINFDNALYITASDEYYVSALFDVSTRDLIKTIIKSTSMFELSRSWIKVTLDSPFGRKIEYLGAIIKNLADLSNLLTAQKEIKERLIDNLLNDPVDRVRYNNLKHLIKMYSSDDKASEAFRKALGDSDLLIQIIAAKQLKEEGIKYLLKMLGKLETLTPELIISILNHLREKIYTKSIGMLHTVYEKRDEIDVRIAVLLAFEQFGDTSLSPFLVDELNKTKGDERLQVIHTLAACGTVDAVEPLFKMMEGSLNPFLNNALQKSIAKIQSRLGGVEKGWLTVENLSEKEGGLTISDNADLGSLSMEENDS